MYIVTLLDTEQLRVLTASSFSTRGQAQAHANKLASEFLTLVTQQLSSTEQTFHLSVQDGAFLISQHGGSSWRSRTSRTRFIIRLENLGTSHKQLVSELRLDRAKEMLNDEDQSITSISYELGYTHPSAFTRFFKQRVGIGPEAYRAIAECGP